jgi:hypothetical protein
MSQISNQNVSDTTDVPSELAELNDVVQQLPVEHRDAVTIALKKVIDSTKRRRKILSLVQDALSQLRLDMKYLVFDLEATRRERDDFREKLDHP